MERVQVVVGIDPGISGAIAILGYKKRSPIFLSVHSMPIHQKRSGRNQVDVEALWYLLDAEIASKGAQSIKFMIEQVSAMPGQGVSGMFSLGDSFGTVRAVASRYSSHQVGLVSPVKWKGAMGLLKKKKAASLTLARRLYPAARHLLYRKKDEGRAEAILIAHYARKIQGW